MSSWIFNVSKDGDSKASVGSLFQCLTTVAGKRIFHMREGNFLYINLCQFVPVVSCPVPRNHLKSAFIFLLLLISYLHTLIKSSLNFFFSRLNSPCSFRLFSYGRYSTPLVIFVALCWACSHVSMVLSYWGVQNWTQ